jgi:hypothetical protein
MGIGTWKKREYIVNHWSWKPSMFDRQLEFMALKATCVDSTITRTGERVYQSNKKGSLQTHQIKVPAPMRLRLRTQCAATSTTHQKDDNREV